MQAVTLFCPCGYAAPNAFLQKGIAVLFRNAYTITKLFEGTLSADPRARLACRVGYHGGAERVPGHAGRMGAVAGTCDCCVDQLPGGHPPVQRVEDGDCRGCVGHRRFAGG